VFKGHFRSVANGVLIPAQIWQIVRVLTMENFVVAARTPMNGEHPTIFGKLAVTNSG
jgi:hypothetical protein